MGASGEPHRDFKREVGVEVVDQPVFELAVVELAQHRSLPVILDQVIEAKLHQRRHRRHVPLWVLRGHGETKPGGEGVRARRVLASCYGAVWCGSLRWACRRVPVCAGVCAHGMAALDPRCDSQSPMQGRGHHRGGWGWPNCGTPARAPVCYCTGVGLFTF